MYDTWEIPERRTLHKSSFLAIMHMYLLPRWLSGKESPCNAGDVVRSLDWEDPLEEEMATTPVFLPGTSHGQTSLVGYSPWGHKESDMTEAT